MSSMSSLSSISPPVKVFMSPFALSTIMLDNSNSHGDQEGFLIGSTYKSVRYEINDQSMCNPEEDLMMSIFSAFPCGKYLSFYDCRGVINIDYLKEFLAERFSKVIGWYRYRRNVPPYPSAREGIIHRNLMRIFHGNLEIGDNFFAYGVFGSSVTETGATHTYDYAFYIERPDKFLPLSLTMHNLIDTKSKYRSSPLTGNFTHSMSFSSVLNISWSFESNWQTEDVVQQMHQLLREKCGNLGEELIASESVNANIESDIKLLEEELAKLQANDNEKEEVAKETINSENDGDGNVPPREEPNAQPIKKRYWSEVVDFESEKIHPMYGKYFEQNRVRDQEGQASSDGSDNSGCKDPPSKKIKILQENKRVIDHDYSSASDEDSHKYIQDMEDDKADDLDGISLPSETEDFIQTDVNVSQEVVIVTQKDMYEEEEDEDTDCKTLEDSATGGDEPTSSP